VARSGVLRKLFGPSRDEIWRQLAADIGGEYIPSTFWKRDRVEAAHGEWAIVLDTYFHAAAKADFTRIRAPYINPDGFRFTVYRRGLFSGVATRLGMQDVEVGDNAFDRDFVIKSSEEGRLRTLFANARIRELIDAQPRIHFTVREASREFRDRVPAPADELCFEVPGVIKDLDRLKLLFDLFAETLDQLCRMGSAYEEG
jgi:hypothetical protein